MRLSNNFEIKEDKRETWTVYIYKQYVTVIQ